MLLASRGEERCSTAYQAQDSPHSKEANPETQQCWCHVDRVSLHQRQVQSVNILGYRAPEPPPWGVSSSGSPVSPEQHILAILRHRKHDYLACSGLAEVHTDPERAIILRELASAQESVLNMRTTPYDGICYRGCDLSYYTLLVSWGKWLSITFSLQLLIFSLGP